ncbi:hypothetical protein CIG2463D_0771 [Campylobacter iguaniorum]|uniref:Stringent starvation protein B n=1 Tax=Campylobacter iguaniorum TaxID=1244531 RepID=A0A076F8Q4_9BACT|nr:hypothetical protein [Campylobacter iguaniorum]AII14615.1 hypothetical protein CIG1485E_0770 [Campylobacter iguaniorum]ALV24350.1 hypothetical protein CIG2463D_0771 [Campylobacter iguaniorum]
MLENILKDDSFCTLMKMHVYECLEYVLQKNAEFSVLVNLKYTKFTPDLPAHIKDSFKSPVILFTLGGYTLQSANLSQNELSFEAGFGSENFASLVEVPLGAIVQILVSESPILINFSEYKEDASKVRTEKSKNIFMSNPNNKTIFKKKD